MPIVVGIIGLIGVIVGQLINAWREKRTWKREQEREELRWERERFKLTQDDVQNWRETRVQEYGTLIKLIDRFVDLLAASLNSTDIDELKVIGRQLSELTDPVNESLSRVELVASEKIASVIFIYRVLIKMPLATPLKGGFENFDIDELHLHLKDDHRNLSTTMTNLVKKFREDLGLAESEEKKEAPA